MNELLFFLQVALVTFFCKGAEKFGKSALVASVAINAIVANLFVLKQIELFSFTVTGSDAFAIGSLLSLNLLQEKYGIVEAKKATIVCFFMMLFFVVVSLIHLSFVPSPLDDTHNAYSAVLSQTPRLLAASIAVFLFVQQVDRAIFSFFKAKFPKKSFSFRSTISLLISQGLDTILFSILGLYGLVFALFDVIIVSYFLKMIAIGTFTTLLKSNK